MEWTNFWRFWYRWSRLYRRWPWDHSWTILSLSQPVPDSQNWPDNFLDTVDSFTSNQKYPRDFTSIWKLFDSFSFRYYCTSIVALRLYTFDSEIHIGLFTWIERYHVDAFTSIKTKFLSNLHFDNCISSNRSRRVRKWKFRICRPHL